MTSTFSIQQEHAEGYHDKFGYKPPSCTDCWPNGAPAAPQRPPEPYLPPPPPKLPAVSGWSSLGDAITRIQQGRKQPERTGYGPDEVVDRLQLPWCGMCHGKRRLRLDREPGEHGFGLTVPCHDCFEQVLMQEWLQRLWGELPEMFKDWTLNTFPIDTERQREVVAIARELLEDSRQPWGFFSGPPGLGKTGLSVGILDAAIREIHRPAMFKQSGDILMRIRGTYRSKNAMAEDEYTLLDSLYAADLLVIDDLGSETDTDWASAELFQLINGRHDRKRQTIITSNWNLKQLAERIGLPAVSRIQEMTLSARYRIDFTGLPYLRRDQ